MTADSPISAGFRTAWREPAIVLAEIAWRWSFAIAALAIAAASALAYLNTLPVTDSELAGLRAHPRWLVTALIGHILYGSSSLIATVAIILPAISALWMAAATFGRAATLKALLKREEDVAFAPQLGLNFLRSAAMLASVIGYLGAAIVAGRIAAGAYESRPGVFVVVFVAVGAVIAIVRSRIDWFLGLGSIPIARDGCDSFAAISRAVGLFRRHAAKFAVAGAVFGTIHTALFAFCSVTCLLVLSLAGKAPQAAMMFLLAVIALAYFAAVDFLYVARLAAYIAIDEDDRTPRPVVTAELIPPAAQPHPPLISGPGLPSPEGASG